MNFFLNLFLFLIGFLSKSQERFTQLSDGQSIDLLPCPRCGSHHTIKNGSVHNGKPKRQCKDSGRQFVTAPTNITVSQDTKQFIDRLLLERISLRGIARVTGVSWSWLQQYVNHKFRQIPLAVKVSAKSKGRLTIECDEMWSFVSSKLNKQWIWLAIDRDTREIVGCYVGKRKSQSAQKLWASLPGVCR